MTERKEDLRSTQRLLKWAKERFSADPDDPDYESNRTLIAGIEAADLLVQARMADDDTIGPALLATLSTDVALAVSTVNALTSALANLEQTNAEGRRIGRAMRQTNPDLVSEIYTAIDLVDNT